MARGPRPFVQKIAWEFVDKGYRKAKRQLDRYENAVEDAEDAQEDLKDSAGGIGGRLSDMARTAKHAIGGVLAGAATAAAAALGRGAQQAAQFEKRMAEVATLMEGDATDAIEKYGDELDRIRQNTPVATDLTQALYQTISAGIDEEEATDFLETAARAGVAGVSNTKTAVDLLTSAINAYGKEATDAEEVSDSFFTAVEEGKTTFDELGTSLGRILPLAAQLGVSLDEVNASIATLTAGGLPTDQAATALRGVFTQFLRNAEEFRKKGIQIQEVLDERGLAGALREVKEATGGSAEEIQKLFPDVEGLNAVLAITGAQSEKFADSLGAMQMKAGATDDAFSDVEKSAASMFQTFKNNLSVTLKNLGEAVLPTLNAGLESMVQYLREAGRTDLEGTLATLRDVGFDERNPELFEQLQERNRRNNLRQRLDTLEGQIGDVQIPLKFNFSEQGLDLAREQARNIGREVSTVFEEMPGALGDFTDPTTESAGRLTVERLKRVREGMTEYLDVLGDTLEAQDDLDSARSERIRARIAAVREGIRRQTRAIGLLEERKALQQSLDGGASVEATVTAGGEDGESDRERFKQQLKDILANLGSLKDLGDELEAVGFMDSFAEPGALEDLNRVVETFNKRVERMRDKRLSTPDFDSEAFAKDVGQLRKTTRKALEQYEKALKRAGVLTPRLETQFKKARQAISGSQQPGSDLQRDLETTVENVELVGTAVDNVGDDADDASEETEELGKHLQDAAGLVQGINDIAGAIGGIDDETQKALGGLSTMVDRMGRLIELKNTAVSQGGGGGSFSDLFSTAGGAISGVSTIVGAVGGLASIASGLIGGDDGRTSEQVSKLRESIAENVAALRRNTEAIYEESRVGADVSQEEISEAAQTLEEIRTRSFQDQSESQQQRDIAQLESTAPFFEGFGDLLDEAKQTFVDASPGLLEGNSDKIGPIARQFLVDPGFTLSDAKSEIESLQSDSAVHPRRSPLVITALRRIAPERSELRAEIPFNVPLTRFVPERVAPSK